VICNEPKGARSKWIEVEKDPVEREQRANSDFLTYCNEDGLFADFHANRHTFISNLGKAGIAPKLAQTLARHSDPKLTMNVYTHVDQSDQVLAIAKLPPPPTGRAKLEGGKSVVQTSGSSSHSLSQPDINNSDFEPIT